MTHKGPGQLRLLGATLGAVLAVVVLAGPASARVSMHSFEARSGGTDVGLTLRVPNEKDNASTVTVRVALPLGTPLIGVLVRPLAGWAATVTTAKLAKPVKTDDGTITEAASQITWTGGRIGPGQYQDFDFEVSQLPVAKELEFKVLQTYSDGDVVRWIDSPRPARSIPRPHCPSAVTAAPATPARPRRSARSALPIGLAHRRCTWRPGWRSPGRWEPPLRGCLAGLALRRRRAA